MINNNNDEDIEIIEELDNQEELVEDSPSFQPSYDATGADYGSKIRSNHTSPASIAGTAADISAKGVKAAGNVADAAGKTAQVTGKAMKVAGKGAQAAGKGIEAASTAVGGALSAIPVVGGVLGGAVKAAGTGVGKGTQALGKGLEKGGDVTEKAGKKAEQAGKKAKEKGKKLQDSADRIKNAKGKNYKMPKIGESAVPKKDDVKDKANELGDKAKEGAKKGLNDLKDGVKDAAKDMAKAGDITQKLKPEKFDFVEQIKKLKRRLILFGTLAAIALMLVAIIIEVVMSPILEVVESLMQKWDTIKIVEQKGDNLYAGFGFKTTKQAFLDEVDYLYERYDEQLDIPLIMATLYYTEQGSYDEDFGSLPDVSEDGVDAKAAVGSIKSLIKSRYENVDENGLRYTAGKIYRLRRLARNQMESPNGIGDAIPTAEENIPLSDFVEEMKDQLSDDVVNLFTSLPSLTEGVDYFRKLYELIEIYDGEETLDTTTAGNSEILQRCIYLLNSILVFSGDITDIHWSVTEGFTVDVARFEANDDNYRKYLKEYYIPHMPEFKPMLGKAKDRDKEIDHIISGIYQYAEDFDGMFDYNRHADAESTDNTCEGTIEPDLVEYLKIPVNGTEFNFDEETGFGISGGVKNNGVDLTADSSGITEGAEVKAIYGGKVTIHNNNCNTSTNPSCDPKGNYVEISHTVKATDNTYELISYYTHLKDISVANNKTVKKGDVIGHVGSTGDVTEPTLHFELKKQSGVYLNPTNLFIPCDYPDYSETGELVGKTDQERVWCYLTNTLKYTKGKAAAAMGNISVESGGTFAGWIVQGDTNDSEHKFSKEYTAKVDSGKISKSDFVHRGPGGGGYGIVQWTYYTRKDKLYDYIKKDSSKSISDLEQQLKFFHKESKGYKCGTYEKTEDGLNSIRSGAINFMTCYEGPSDQSSTAKNHRADLAVSIYNKYKKTKCASSTKIGKITKTTTSTKVKSTDSRELKIEKYITALKEIADDDSVGYAANSGTRNMNPNVDCSSFVYYGLYNSGMISKMSWPFSTGTMGPILEKAGFKKMSYSEKKLKNGDILVNSHHTAVYLEGHKQIAAHTDYDGKNGDSLGTEVNVSEYKNHRYGYESIYRLK